MIHIMTSHLIKRLMCFILGGHTSEILRLVQHLGPHYHPRYYVMANTDKMSEDKVVKLEAEKSDRKDQVCDVRKKHLFLSL